MEHDSLYQFTDNDYFRIRTIQCSSAILLFGPIWCTICRFPGEIEGLRSAAICWDYIALMFVGSYACMHALQYSIMIRTECTGC